MSKTDAQHPSPVIEAINLHRSYKETAGVLNVLSGIDITVMPGEMVAIVGTSGSGKSTLLNLLGGLDLPSSGEVFVCGNNLAAISEKQRGVLRNKHMGFVYQFHHLLPEFNAVENVAMPLLIRKESPGLAREKALAVLEQVGLSARVAHKPSQLSGGERQRVAIARALVTEPDVVFADEPTGNLDEKTAASVQQLMMELNQRQGIAFVIVTHDQKFAHQSARCVELNEGRLVNQSEA